MLRGWLERNARLILTVIIVGTVGYAMGLFIGLEWALSNPEEARAFLDGSAFGNVTRSGVA